MSNYIINEEFSVRFLHLSPPKRPLSCCLDRVGWQFGAWERKQRLPTSISNSPSSRELLRKREFLDILDSVNSSYLARYLHMCSREINNISFMQFNWFLFPFQVPSPARPGCVFHCCTVPQSWSPGPRVGLPHAHPVKHCAPATHSGLIFVSLFNATALCLITSALNSHT